MRKHALTLLAVVALLLSGCNSGSDKNKDTDTPTDISNRIHIMAGHSGDAVAEAGSAEYRITLRGIEPEVDWYSDRPERDTGSLPTTEFMSRDWHRIHDELPPNALLQYRDDSGIHALFGRVDTLHFDAASQTASLQLTLAKATHDITTGQGHFTAPVLTLLNNVGPEQEESSFALAAAESTLQVDEHGRHHLLLDGVDQDVLWMNNAPAREGDFEHLADFVTRWAARFSDAAPNASLAGDIGNGDYDIWLLTLSSPDKDPETGRLSFEAVPMPGHPVPPPGTRLSDAVLFVDAGPRATASTLFAQRWSGIAYSPVPAKFNQAPDGAFFDSDLTADAFQAIWGSKGDCGRNDLQAMAAAGVNMVRLYDYNFQRGSTVPDVAGNGHIAFLDKAHSLGIRVIIPISNYNFMRQDGDNRPWERIENTVTQIIDSTRVNGRIHPAVHSFSIGNELDLPKYGMTADTLIPDAVHVATLIHQRAPDHFMTVPLSNADERRYYDMLRDLLPADLYENRFYNSVQTFKIGDDLRDSILAAYDTSDHSAPLVITELGFSNMNTDSVAHKIDIVVNQAKVVSDYMAQNPDSLVKGFTIFEWQNMHWKRGGGTADNSESTFGIHAYDGTLCESHTGEFVIHGDGWNHRFHNDEHYDVDRLKPLTSDQYPQGLLEALSVYFR